MPERRRQSLLDRFSNRRWAAVGGTLLFVGLGLALAPGLARFGPAPAAQPDSPAPGPETAGRDHALPGAPPVDRPDAAMPAPGASPPVNAFDCMILPSETIEIGSSIEGRIERIEVERSDYVEAGQVLVQLESAVEEAAVHAAEARAARRADTDARRVSLALGEKRRARARELFDRNALSLDLRDELETDATLAAAELEGAIENHRVAEFELEQARAALDRRTIRSPVSGFVVDRTMSRGEVVDEETILRVAQVDPLRVEVILPSTWYGRVKPGDVAEVVPEDPRNQPRTAQVSIVDPVIDGASGTFGARLTLPNPDHDLPAGLRCQLVLLGRSADETPPRPQSQSPEEGA